MNLKKAEATCAYESITLCFARRWNLICPALEFFSARLGSARLGFGIRDKYFHYFLKFFRVKSFLVQENNKSIGVLESSVKRIIVMHLDIVDLFI